MTMIMEKGTVMKDFNIDILYMNRIFINKHITTFSILLFIGLFSLLNYSKPSFMYNKDGSLRPLGLRKSRSTVTPISMITCALAILSYCFVLLISNY